MNVKITMLADVGEREKGKEYEVEASVAKTLIDAGLAEAEKKSDLASEITGIFETKLKESVEAIVKGLSSPADKPTVTDVKERLADDPKGGYIRAGQFLKDIAIAGRPNGIITPKLASWTKAVKVAGHMSEGDDAQGGFLVPGQFVADLHMNSIIDDGIPGRCTNLPMQVNQVSFPYVNETSHAANVFGGVTVYRTGEAAQKQASKPTFGLCTLTLHKLTVLTYVSDELIEDSPITIEPMLAKMFPEAINFTVADDILNGTGAGMGLGVIPAPATITHPRAGAGAIAFADIINMWSRLYPRSAGNAVWYANPDTFPQLATMSLAVGTGGAPVYLPANGAADSPFGTLMGRPLILTELAQTLGTAGDIILADLGEMTLGTKGGVKSDSSMHLRFDYNETAFRSEIRVDNQPWWPAPLTPRYSTVTTSPFVILGDAAATTTTAAATTTT